LATVIISGKLGFQIDDERSDYAAIFEEHDSELLE
jgi:hypothetical protein